MPPIPLRLWRRLSLTVLGCGALASGFFAVPSGAASNAGPSVTWSTLDTPVSPPGLTGAASAFDTDSGKLVVFGGVTASGGLSGTTWLWDGTSWSTVSAGPGQPAPRELASMAFDPAQHQLILFGGIGAGGALLDDTWAWNGASWYELNSGGSGGPTPRAGAALAYDGSGDLLLFGGMGVPAAAATLSPAPSTSTVPGSTTTGSSATTALPTPSTTTLPPPTQPSPTVTGSGMATLDDTWMWNGSSWTQQHPTTSPPARAGAAVASNTGSHSVTLFGGSATPFGAPGSSATPLGDTWEWAGSTWTMRSHATGPSPRYGGVFGYDSAIGASVLFGGDGTSGALGDTWTWNGTTWSPVDVSASPAPRDEAAGQFDSTNRQFVVFGGTGANGATLADTNVLTTTAPVALTPPGGGSSRGSPPTSAPGAVALPPPATTGSGSSTSAPRSIGSSTSRAPSTTTSGAPARSVRPGDVVILRGSGFRPRATIVITFHSSPVLVGTTTARTNGSFTATVTVPAHAPPGQHSFEASGPNAEGQTTALWTPVRVLALTASHGTSLRVTLAMLGIAIGIPVVSWLVLSARSNLRRQRVVRD